MLVLAAADTIAGHTNGVNSVTCTIQGMELSGGVETYKVLYQGQLATSTTTLYTVPASTQAFIKSISAVNTITNATRTCQFHVNGTTASNVITPLFTLQADALLQYEDGLGWQMLNPDYISNTSIFGLGETDTNPCAVARAINNYGISGSLGESIDRNLCPEVNTTVMSSGVLYLQGLYLPAGIAVNNISFFCATTATSGASNFFFAFYSREGQLLAASTDQTNTAWSANTIRTLSVTPPDSATAYVTSKAGLYYCGLVQNGGTQATLKAGTARTGGQLMSTGGTATQGASTTGITSLLPRWCLLPTAAVTIGTVWCAVT